MSPRDHNLNSEVHNNTYAISCAEKDGGSKSHLFLFIGPVDAYSIANAYGNLAKQFWDVRIWRGTHTILLNKHDSHEPLIHSIRGGHLSLIDIDELKRDKDVVEAAEYCAKAERDIEASTKLSPNEQN